MARKKTPARRVVFAFSHPNSFVRLKKEQPPRIVTEDGMIYEFTGALTPDGQKRAKLGKPYTLTVQSIELPESPRVSGRPMPGTDYSCKNPRSRYAVR